MVAYICVLVLFDLIIRSSGSAPYVIEIKAEKYKNSVRLKDTRLPSLVLNEPFTIHVESDVKLSTIRCYSYYRYGTEFVYEDLKYHLNYYTFKTNYNATYQMNDTWTCILSYDKNGAGAISLNFRVTVKEPDSQPFRNTVKEEEVVAEQTTEADLETRQSKALVFDLLKDSYSPFIHINIYGSSGQTYHIIKTMLELNKTYTIRLRVASDLRFSNDIKRIICNKKSYITNVHVNDPLIQNTKLSSSSFFEYFTIITIAATAGLESDWECKLNNKDPITVLRISSFPVVFKHQAASATKNLPEVSVNDVIIPTNVTLTGFDAIGEYSYIAGELAKITCTHSEYEKMRLEFGNGTNSQLISTDNVKENLTMIMKLTENLHGSFLSCIVRLPTKISIIKLSFIQNTTMIDKDQPQFYINSLPLVPVFAYDGKSRYKYEYYRGETLAIKGFMTNLNNQWFCTVSNNNPQLKPIENQNTNIDVSVTLGQNDDKAETKSFQCSAGKTTVHVSLTPIPIRFYPTITGLSSANTLYSYKKNDKDYRIKYIHPPQKNLNLTCSYDENVHECDWNFNRKEVTATEPVQTKESKPNHNTIQNIFKPVQNGISTTIECRCQIKVSNKNIKTSVEIYTETPKSKTSTEIPAIVVQYSTEATLGNAIPHVTDHEGASMPMINLTLVKGSDGRPEGRAESTGLKPEKEFQIYVENDFNLHVLKHIRCFYTRNSGIEFINADLDNSRAGYVALGLASREMKWPWRCNITNVYDKKSIYVDFTIKFPNADRVVPATINVNNEIINTTSSIIGQTEIASGVYQYRTGELVKVTCTRDMGNTMSLNSPIFSTQLPTDVSELTAYIKMTDKHDGLSIDCNVRVTLPPNINTYVVRLKFSKIQFNSDKYPQFVVNGLELVPKKIYDTNEYQYEYYDGETLSIMGSIGHGDEPWQCITDRDYTHQLGHALEQSKGLNNLTVTLHNDIKEPVSPRLVCNKGTYMANLEIKPIPTTYYPNIIGLSLANTLYRYEQPKYDYKIKYSHPDNQNLSLTCASYMAECKWDISNNEVISKDEELIRSQGMLMSKKLFVPRKDCNSTIITCTCKNGNNIKYYRTSAEIQCERTKQEAEMITKDADYKPSTPKPEYKNIIPTDNSESQNLVQLLAIIAGTVIVVALVILMVVNIIKRKRRLEKEQQSNNNAGAMATPVQWNENNYTQPLATDENPYSVPYVEKNIENMYAKPQPKGQRAPPETLYAEIEGQGEPNYAAVGRQCTPKGQGMNTEYANSQPNKPTYGQVLPKSLRKPQSAPQVLPKPPKSDNYAEVLPRSERNRPDGTNYTNVFENPRYGNMETKTDYAEPAYCELNPWK